MTHKVCLKCLDFLDIEQQAQIFVDETIATAIEQIKHFRGLSSNYESPSTSIDQSRDIWPAIEDFSIDEGCESISNFVSSWPLVNDWLFCINFLLDQSDYCSDFFFYEVIWSIPTKEYPIPQATASVYFTIEVSRVKPPCLPVHVTYMFEGSRYVHTPDTSSFREEWLLNVLKNKIDFFKTLRF